MSKQNKESLEKLLLFICDICEDNDNDWFREKLIDTLSTYENSNTNYSNIEQFDKIERYLKLDGFKIIDYSWVKDETVGNQLFRDSIEMSKYRLGKINDTINFDEFCRYAYLQVEELINYYYHVKFKSDLTEIINFIKKHNKKFNGEYINDLNKISSFYKINAFLREYNLNNKPMKFTIDFLRSLRNDLSHRNSFDLKSEDEILSNASQQKIDITKSYFDFSSSNKEKIDLYNNGRFIFLKRLQDYKEIIESLTYFSEAIKILAE
ncbi:hypothetical protein [uncultured Lacinutrix sp.]|uniref:hypothetical protein n=1 Tax=uncultured Lacinutrix sp. TaxID=574032 RepID=UPI002608FC04|nr:hypothetical protein [uncultured Lacinutrix sp.]